MSNNIDLYIQEIEGSKQQIKNAIIAKGVTPTGGLTSYAGAISQIVSDPDLEVLEVTIEENGLYQYNSDADGYSEVKVNVDIPIPAFETQSKEVTIKKNGTTSIVPDSGYDGLSEVNVTVQVSTGGSDKPQILNGFRFTGGDIAQVDFSQYDWSMVYDTSEFFKLCTHSTGDWSNFEENFNGVIGSVSYMFAGNNTNVNKGVQSLPNLGEMTKDLTSMTNMCSMNVDLSDVSTLTSWNTSKVIDATSMFGSDQSGVSYRPKFTTVDMTGFGHPDGYNSTMLFCNLGNLQNIIGELKPAGSALSMFSGCSNLTSIPQMDTSKVTNMDSMFSGCSKLTSIPQMDTSKVTSMGSTFSGCSNLTSIPQMDTSKVTSMNSMFSNCSNLTSIPQMDTSKVTSMSYMFYQCSKLITIPQLDTSKVTNMERMFNGCTSLTSIPQMDISEVTSVNRMFAYCSNITELRFKGNPSKITDTSNMFYVVYTTGTFYYDERYDYSVIINRIPATWTTVPYNVEEYENNM